MMICTKCQEIYDNNYDNNQFGGLCPKKHCSGDVVWIDENMVLPCKMLWNKGYKTMFTCEGHYKEWGGLPYITFEFPIQLIPELSDFDFDNNIHHHNIGIWADDTLSVNWYAGIDYHKAKVGEFRNEQDSEWWRQYGNTIETIFKSDFCKGIFHYSVNHIVINISQYGLVELRIYFKSVLDLLIKQHPDEDCECSELIKFHSEDSLFLMHLQHEWQCICHLIEYIKGLPDIKSNKI